MYKYLLVILEKGAVPFCHYSNPGFHSLGEPQFMPVELLERIVGYANEKNLPINFLYGKHLLPTMQQELVDAVSHVKLIPLALHLDFPDGVLVLDSYDRDEFYRIGKDSIRNLILHVDMFDLPRLAADVEMLKGSFKRLNIHLVGMEHFSEQDLSQYETQIKLLADMLQQTYKVGDSIKINVLTDRLLLSQMNNCDAGNQYLTIAPNGQTYLCPAFYYDDENSNALGLWNESQEEYGENTQLLSLGCAPICSQCDAFHCKRCIYLNKLTTLEINVPSKQQCVIAHIEREASRQMLRRLRNLKPFDKLPEIRSLGYRDPFDIVAQPIGDRPVSSMNIPCGQDTEDYLIQIYELQQKILQKL